MKNSYMQKKEEIVRNWYVIDADGITLGRLAAKVYYNHSGYTGGLRERTARVMKENYPVEMVERAVKGMLPKGRLGRQMYRKLFVYAEGNHPHKAQMPVELKMD